MAIVKYPHLFPFYSYREQFTTPYNPSTDKYKDINLEDAVTAFWKVKKWKFSINGFGTSNYDNVNQTHFDLSKEFTLKVGSTYEYSDFEEGVIIDDYNEMSLQEGGAFVETDLICTTTDAHRKSKCDFEILTRQDGVGSVIIRGGLGNTSSTGLPFKTSPFSDKMGIGIWLEGSTALRRSNFSIYIPIVGYPDFTESTVGNFNLKIKNVTYSFPIIWRKGVVTTGGSANLNINVDMEAAEYWPYDPGDGCGPIYDSQTGEELRDPILWDQAPCLQINNPPLS